MSALRAGTPLEDNEDKACATCDGDRGITFKDLVKIAIEARDTLKQQNTKSGGQPHEIKTKVIDVINHLSQKTEQYETTADVIKSTTARLENNENTLEELKESSSKTWPKTFAQAVSQPDPRAVQRAERRKQEQNLRRERAKYEVMLTAAAAPDETKNLLATLHEKEITKRCQHAIDVSINGDAFDKPRLNGVNKLAQNNIRLQCRTPEQAEELQNINWGLAFKGLCVYRPNFGIVVHHVPKAELDMTCLDNEDSRNLQAVKIQRANTLPVTKIAPLRRKNSERTSAHHSLVIFTNDPDATDRCIKYGLYINYRRYRVERYAPHLQITQCFKCYDYGHRALHCKRKVKCGKCGEEHPTKECTNTVQKCAQCSDAHEAWHYECPMRIAESRRLEELKRQASPLFTS